MWEEWNREKWSNILDSNDFQWGDQPRVDLGSNSDLVDLVSIDTNL